MRISKALNILGFNEESEDPSRRLDRETHDQLVEFKFLRLVLKQKHPLFLFNLLVESSVKDVSIIAKYSALEPLDRAAHERALDQEIELRKGAVLLRLEKLHEEDDIYVKKIATVLASRCKNRTAAGTLLSEISREHDDAFRYDVKNHLMLRRLEEISTSDGIVLIREKFAISSANPQGAFLTTMKRRDKYYDYKARLFRSWPYCVSQWLRIYSPLIDFYPETSEWEAFKEIEEGSS